jgi:predicted double-glycine peptidase
MAHSVSTMKTPWLPMILWLLLAWLLLAPLKGACAFPLPLTSGPRLDAKVISLKEARTVGIVLQQRDYSCGAAAVATLLTYQFGRPTGEAEVLDKMRELGNEELIKQKGFSLLDMKRFLESINYQAAGFKLNLEQLADLKIPGIILIDTLSYQHFVVLKGVRDGEAFLADPALGNRAMSLEDVGKAWNGVFFAAVGPEDKNAPGFHLRKPEVRGMSRVMRASDKPIQIIGMDPTMKIWDINKPWR